MTQIEISQVDQLPERLWWWAWILPLALWLMLISGVAQADGFRSPEECQGYTGQEHLNCLYRYIGIQEENTGKAEERANVEKEMLEQIHEQRDQVERNPFVGQEPQRRLAEAPPPPSAVVPPPSSAATTPSFRSPDECRAYTGNAHLNCLYAYIEMQQSKTGKVEEELRAQRGMLGQLRDQVDRQASASNNLQQRLAERDSSPSTAPVYVPSPVYPGYGYPGYGYPGYGYSGFGYLSPGLSLYFGAPGYYYGRPFYGPRFFGPRFYGPRFYGPGFYGPRFFGHHRR